MMSFKQKNDFFVLSSSQKINIEKLEAHVKETLHDLISRRQSQPLSKSDTETDKKLVKEDRKLSKTDLDSLGMIFLTIRIN